MLFISYLIWKELFVAYLPRPITNSEIRIFHTFKIVLWGRNLGLGCNQLKQFQMEQLRKERDAAVKAAFGREMEMKQKELEM